MVQNKDMNNNVGNNEEDEGGVNNMNEDTNEDTNEDLIINIKTVQSGAFRILIEALKEILTDTNIIFDETGIKLIATDSSKIVLIHMKLHSENFEHYYCQKK